MVATAWAQKKDNEHRVYEFVVESTDGSIDDVATNLSEAASVSGWKVLASSPAGVPEGCSYGARVLSLYHPEYAARLMDINRKTAPYAIVDRINLFEDENGLHVSMVNPRSIARTVLMEDASYTEIINSHAVALRTMISDAVDGVASTREYGQKRKKGYIGRTMGVMAGGKFVDKIQDKAVVPGGELLAVADKVREGLSQPGPKWDLTLAYELALPEYDTVIFGTTGTAMESKSFSIVKAGSNKDRKKLSCPGLAHAAAYPIEVVLVKDEDDVKVQLVDAMYRMKMYFEDAGKMSFMKNMGMPGSLADEIKNQILAVLGDYPQ
jgi:hypothetical protein